MGAVTPFNPDDWKDAFVLMFLGVCSVLVAGLPLWNKVRKIDTQVSNSHDENLRDEITRGFREVREDMQLLRQAQLSLRDEMRAERKERIEGDRARDTVAR